MRRSGVIMLGVLAVLASTSTADGAVSGGCPNTAANLAKCIVGRASSAGDYATTIASGTATKPSRVAVVVYTSTLQSVDMNWTLVCSRGFGAGSKSGRLTRST